MKSSRDGKSYIALTWHLLLQRNLLTGRVTPESVLCFQFWNRFARSH